MLAQSIFPVLVIFIILIIIITLIYGIYFIHQNKKNIDQNWPNYKCKPYVFPFAGWFVGPNTTNPGNNFRECSWLIFKSFFDVLISPFVKILSIIVGILTNFTQDIQNVRKMVNYIRNSIRGVAMDVYNKLKDTYYRLAYVYKSFMRVFASIFKTMKAAFNSLLYSYYTLASIWNGPIGGSARFFCFDPTTPILMKDGSFKLIKDIELGDETKGGKVLATYKFESTPNEMYKLYDPIDNKKYIIVSGSHLIKEQNKWIRIKDSIHSVLYSIGNGRYNEPYVYTLRTSESMIFTHLDNMILKDFDEINTRKINYSIFRNQIEYLNLPDNIKHIFEIKDYSPFHYCSGESDYFHPYFDGNNRIKLDDETEKLIKNINIGDKLLCSGKVLGVSKLLVENTPIYKMDIPIDYFNKINFTQGTICKNISNNQWQIAEQNIFSQKDNNYKEKFMYSLFTENGHIIINHIKFQDHDNGYQLQDKVDKFVMDYLNKPFHSVLSSTV